eukprot:CAMPEP_0172583686 /NCGR_PEP_ID=MMETSP1068-20121228/3269_1 /TAXON_ID=35684 /ORGANISM="Pseudopedinella elastica, Strain CCMP716" /LENGTH=146 /DNA_ID=CAMNT_0013377565 /DNA_START=176 /DNA_END=616 /DNA_ORIENTATION=-
MARIKPIQNSAHGRKTKMTAVQPTKFLTLRGGMSAPRAWAILFGATAFELISTGFMHKAKGFSVPLPALGAVLFYALSFYTFNLSLRALEISVAYAVWSAVVMAALSIIGMTWLGESVSTMKIVGIIGIIFGTTCLSLADVAKTDV